MGEMGEMEKMEGNGEMGEMEGNGGKWRKMGEYGGKWGEMGGNAGKWGNSGHSTQDVGRGGMWWDLVEENGRKMGETMGQNTHFSPSHSSHFSGGRNIFPANPFAKTSPPHSPTEKWEFLPLTDTHMRMPIPPLPD